MKYVQIVCFLLLFGTLVSPEDLKSVKKLKNAEEPCKHTFKDITHEEVLKSEVQRKIASNSGCRDSLSVTIDNCNLDLISKDTFSYVRVRLLHLTFANSSISLIGSCMPDYSPFRLMDYQKGVLEVKNVKTIIGWQWHILKDFPGELQFRALKSDLLYLSSDFGLIARSNVVDVKILQCSLKWLGKNVFAPLKNLKILELRGNLLQSIERSHLPTEATQLKIIDLGKNSLQTLPNDFCNGLNLHTLYLDGNNIHFFNQFVLKYTCGKVQILKTGVSISCNCNITSVSNAIEGSPECYLKDGTILHMEELKAKCLSDGYLNF